MDDARLGGRNSWLCHHPFGAPAALYGPDHRLGQGGRIRGPHVPPRAALRADEIAQGEAGAEFFSFGTNDLTQTSLGLSRDDAAPILTSYAEAGIFKFDPFVSLDLLGVGELVRIGTERGRKVKPGLKIGICGEHGGDPKSVAFFNEIGLDYVSSSPFRVPIARLAAAQAAIAGEITDTED